MNDDLGGEAPCWAHLLDEAPDEIDVVVDLGVVTTDGPSGAVWSLPHGGDLDANLVHLRPGDSVAGHVNPDVDVLIVVRAGSGELEIDGRAHRLGREVLALIPAGTSRTVMAGDSGLAYLSVHRRRAPLGITDRT